MGESLWVWVWVWVCAGSGMEEVGPSWALDYPPLSDPVRITK
jgi:hypothetical protein